jgi:hypothetical protein
MRSGSHVIHESTIFKVEDFGVAREVGIIALIAMRAVTRWSNLPSVTDRSFARIAG